jgi:hypothetical protein
VAPSGRSSARGLEPAAFPDGTPRVPARDPDAEGTEEEEAEEEDFCEPEGGDGAINSAIRPRSPGDEAITPEDEDAPEEISARDVFWASLDMCLGCFCGSQGGFQA